MPPKPRPHGRKPPRAPGARPSGPSLAGDRRRLAIIGLAALAAIVAVGTALAVALGGNGGGGGDARPALEAAGCTLRAVPALPGNHSITAPEGTSDAWNTDPPTSGAHYDVPAVYGVYDEPVNQAQLVHNLEHGAIAVQYGAEVPQATVEQLRGFAESHSRGTVVAPYPKLGSKVTLGAWVTESADEPDKGTGYLASCDAFDEQAFEAFFDAYQFQGPERFPPDSLLPGRA